MAKIPPKILCNSFFLCQDFGQVILETIIQKIKHQDEKNYVTL